MNANVKRGKYARPIVAFDIDKIPDKLISSRAFAAGVIQGLHGCKLPYPEVAIKIVHNILDAIDATPAHNGNSFFIRQSDFKPKGWKYICMSCMQLCWCPPDNDGKCRYKFCPNCGCIMYDELPKCMKEYEAEAGRT